MESVQEIRESWSSQLAQTWCTQSSNSQRHSCEDTTAYGGAGNVGSQIRDARRDILSIDQNSGAQRHEIRNMNLHRIEVRDNPNDRTGTDATPSGSRAGGISISFLLS